MRSAVHPRCLLLVLVLLPALRAHGELDRRIAALDRLIAGHPRDAHLYLQRGELHRLHRDFARASADYATARRLAPELRAVDLCRARLQRDLGNLRGAERITRAFLAAAPRAAAGWRLLAELLEAGERYREAADAWDRAIATAPRVGPDPYLRRARLRARSGGEGRIRALAGLEEGLKRLGGPISLELEALRLEREAGLTKAALLRIERLSRGGSRWLLEKAEVLASAGRRAEALRACTEAMEALRRDTTPRRETPARLAIRKRAERLLSTLTQPPSKP